MHMLNVFLVVIPILSFCSVKTNKTHENSKVTELNRCNFSESDKLFDELILNPKKFLFDDDSCMIELLSFHEKFAINSKVDSLCYKSLGSLASVSDGYVSEGIAFSTVRLFFKDCMGLSNYLFNNNDRTDAKSLLRLFSYGMCAEIYDSENPSRELEKIESHLEKNCSIDVKEYMLNLIKSIDSTICE